MAGANFEFADFTGGIATDLPPTVQNTNTFKVLDNYNLNDDGSVSKRHGYVYNNEYASFASTGGARLEDSNTTPTYGRHRWILSSIGSARKDRLVVVGVTIVGSGIVKYTAEVFSTSGVRLTSAELSYVTPTQTVTKASELPTISMADSDYGVLVGGAFLDSALIVYYDENAGRYGMGLVRIKTRMFEILGTSSISERPTTITPQHYANLFNAGWTPALINQVYADLGVYPSLADIPQYGKITTSDTPSEIGEFSPAELEKNFFGNTPAPRGRDIYEVQTMPGIGDASARLDFNSNSVDAVCFHSGRAFFAVSTYKTSSPNLNAEVGQASERIYYSKLVSDVKDMSVCHQEADPTSEHVSDLVATDGGYIQLKGSGLVYDMVSCAGGVVVTSSEGAWLITGSRGFSATDNYVTVLRKSTTIVPATLSVIGSDAVFVDDGDLYIVNVDDRGVVRAANASAGALKSLINKATDGACVSFTDEDGNYNIAYSEDVISGVGSGYVNDLGLYSVVISLNATKQSVLTSSYQGKYCAILNNTMVGLTVSYDDLVTFNPVPTYYSLIKSQEFSDEYTTVEFLGRYSDGTITVESTIQSAPVVAVAQTNQLNFNDTQRIKEPLYVTTHMKFTDGVYVDDGAGNPVPDDPSQCTLTARFDNKSVSTTPREIYRPRYLPVGAIGQAVPYDSSVVSSKVKIRGRGKTMSLEFRSDEAKNSWLHGYALSMTGVRDV